MRFIRTVLLLAIAAVAGVFAYNSWSGTGWTLRPPIGRNGGVDLEAARKRSAELATTAARTGREAAAKIEDALHEGTLTTKSSRRWRSMIT